jgi:hypothetical protein
MSRMLSWLHVPHRCRHLECKGGKTRRTVGSASSFLLAAVGVNWQEEMAIYSRRELARSCGGGCLENVDTHVIKVEQVKEQLGPRMIQTLPAKKERLIRHIMCLMMRVRDWPCLDQLTQPSSSSTSKYHLLYLHLWSQYHLSLLTPPRIQTNQHTQQLPTCPELSRLVAVSRRSVPATTSTRQAATPKLLRRGSKVPSTHVSSR